MTVLILEESIGMKKYLLVMVIGLVVAVSVAYARRGRSSSFTFGGTPPLAGYCGQTH